MKALADEGAELLDDRCYVFDMARTLRAAVEGGRP